MIIAVPKGNLTPQQKQAIAKKGYIVIECDEPEKIRVINPEQNMDTSDWFMAALGALANTTSSNTVHEFTRELYKRLKKKEEIPVEEINPKTNNQ